MKKILTVIAMAFLVFSSTACTTKTYEIAMITVYDDINDGSFNQATWEGIKEYAVKNGITHQYYRPLTSSESDFLAAITQAVNAGAKIVITPGLFYGFESKFPETQFVVIDAYESSIESVEEPAENVLSIFFNENESGYLAGYSTVKDGFKDLGFIGGLPITSVKKFGIGFIAGAYQAAFEMDIEINFNAKFYTYLNTFSASEEIETLAESWYDQGVSVIHAAAGAASQSVIAAAENKKCWVIGVDIDQSKVSDYVLTSAVKGLGAATYQALSAYYENKLVAGDTWYLGAQEHAISLPIENSRFKNFKASDYNDILAKIMDNQMNVPSNKEELIIFLKSINIEHPDLINKI